jgi:hypothetical protein
MGSGTSRDRVVRFVVATGVFLGVLAVSVVLAVRGNGGEFAYGLDDPYIHLDVARNLREHGTWGINAGEVQSASSSPLWTVLLAASFSLPVPPVWLPFILAMGSAIWLLWLVTSPSVASRLPSTGTLRLAVVVLPLTLGLVPLVIFGMEHVLHAALFVLVLILLDRWLTGDATRGDRIVFFVALAVAALVRIETVFIASSCALAFFVHRRRLGEDRRVWLAPAAGCLAAVGLPLGLFGVVSVAAGQEPVPNSVVAKAVTMGRSMIPDPLLALRQVRGDRLLAIMMVLLVVAFIVVRATDPLRRSTPALLVVLTTASLHVTFASASGFGRYTAYLIAGGVVSLLLASASPAIAGHRAFEPALVAVLVVLFLARPISLPRTVLASTNIHDQQGQVARFLAQARGDEAVAVNDIGWVSWAHPGGVVDMYGLASHEVLEAKRRHANDAAFYADLIARHHVTTIAIYREWFPGQVPPSWVEVGQWCLTSRRITPAYSCVTFYATDPVQGNRLAGDLRRFAPQLPPTVSASIDSSL